MTASVALLPAVDRKERMTDVIVNGEMAVPFADPAYDREEVVIDDGGCEVFDASEQPARDYDLELEENAEQDKFNKSLTDLEWLSVARVTSANGKDAVRATSNNVSGAPLTPPSGNEEEQKSNSTRQPKRRKRRRVQAQVDADDKTGLPDNLQDSKDDKDKRPNFSYKELVVMAMKSQPNPNKVALLDIYSYIKTTFPYYDSKEAGRNWEVSGVFQTNFDDGRKLTKRLTKAAPKNSLFPVANVVEGRVGRSVHFFFFFFF